MRLTKETTQDVLRAAGERTREAWVTYHQLKREYDGLKASLSRQEDEEVPDETLRRDLARTERVFRERGVTVDLQTVAGVRQREPELHDPLPAEPIREEPALEEPTPVVEEPTRER